MSSQKLLGLQSISPQLKPILPFLQRAEELRKQEPIIAYWCAYYAAQVGIGLKARDNASRDVLFNLLGILEDMKKEIGNVDAIDIEAASAAYVENFALKVFQSADNEDRKGVATKMTARKFLAASNFLEVLTTFPKAEVSESVVEDKIRYAKWKAADISRALREGRKPAPGPAGGEDQPPLEDHSVSNHEQAGLPTDGIINIRQPSAHVPSSPAISHHPSSGSPQMNIQSHRRDGSGGSSQSGTGLPPSRPKKAWVSNDVEGHISPSSSPPRSSSMKVTRQEGTPEGNKKVHFSSVAQVVPPIPPKPPSPAEVYQGPPSIYASPSEKQPPSPPSIPTNTISPPQISYSPPRSNIYTSPSHPENSFSSSPPRSYPISRPSPPPPPAPVPITSPRTELTPQLITQVQKHCRFAISSLDYEDAEQAKKELRTALALLGGI